MAKHATPATFADDHYARLQVNPRASPEVIKAAYKALSLKNHPDQNAGHATVFRALTDAYETLSDEDKRKAYDALRNRLDGKIVGAYRILDKIAEGGFGKTYRGEHVRLGTPVCIKHCSTIAPEMDAILEAEARAVWDLRHYAIPVMRDLLRLDDGSSALVMSYVEGPTLMQIIEKHGKMDAEHVAWIIHRVLNALQYLHFHGVVHGDIKPQNIIVQPEKHMAVLVDYGLAMVKPKANDRSLGFTELFAPPEQLRGSTLLPESDLYSLGMTAIFALNASPAHTERREIPSKVPEPLQDFLRSLVVRGVLERPNWQKMDLLEEIQRVREKSFGRARSNMKPLEY